MTTATWGWASSSSMPTSAAIRAGCSREGDLGLHRVRSERASRSSRRDHQSQIRKIPGGRGGYNRWTINGKSWPATNPLFTVQRGKRYRLNFDNNSGDETPSELA